MLPGVLLREPKDPGVIQGKTMGSRGDPGGCRVERGYKGV